MNRRPHPSSRNQDTISALKNKQRENLQKNNADSYDGER